MSSVIKHIDIPDALLSFISGEDLQWVAQDGVAWLKLKYCQNFSPNIVTWYTV